MVPSALNPAFRRKSQEDLCETEVSPVYKVSYRLTPRINCPPPKNTKPKHTKLGFTKLLCLMLLLRFGDAMLGQCELLRCLPVLPERKILGTKKTRRLF